MGFNLIDFRSRLTMKGPFARRSLTTFYWRAVTTNNQKTLHVAEEIASQLFADNTFVGKWLNLMPWGSYVSRFQIGPVHSGFPVDHNFPAGEFEGTRLLILFPGLQQPWINSRITWHTSSRRPHYTQVPHTWEHDFTNDQIWFAYRTALHQFASPNLSSRTLASGGTFYLVCRHVTGSMLRPFAYTVEERPTRQLHRRKSQKSDTADL